MCNFLGRGMSRLGLDLQLGLRSGLELRIKLGLE